MSAQLFFMPIPAVLSRGVPAAGALLTFYLSGTTTKTPVYTTSDLTTQHANPVVADGAGSIPTIYLDDSIVYRLVITDRLGSLIPGCDIDPYTPGTLVSLQGVPGINGGTASNLTIGLFTGAGGQDLTEGGTKPPPEIVFTSGYFEVGRGAASYVLDDNVDEAFVSANPAWSFLDSEGNGYRLAEDQARIMIEAFSATGDATPTNVGTDDAAAFAAARDFQEYFRYATTGGSTDYQPVPEVWMSNRGYRSSEIWILDRAAYRLYGTGNNFNGNGGSAVYFDADIPGIVIQSFNNTGTDLTATEEAHASGTDPRGAQCTHLRDFTIVSRGGTVGDTGQNGMLIHTACIIERVHAFDFGGYAHAITADATHGTNANACQVLSCGGVRCGLGGYYDTGADVNAGVVLNYQAFSNRGFGVSGTNFLGQFYLYYQCDGNGITGSGPSWATNNVSSFTNHNGHAWYVRPGQHVAASTTEPGTDSSIWVDFGAGSTSLGGTWASGTEYQSGGGIYAGGAAYATNNNGRNVFAGYCESNQFQGWSDSNTSYCGPGFSSFQGGSGASLGVVNGALVSGGIGYRGTCANGDTIQSLAGQPSGTDGGFWLFGRGATGQTPWQAKLDSSNVVSFSFSGGSAVFSMSSTGVGVKTLTYSTLPGNFANDAAAATGGVAVGQTYRNGSVLMVRAS